MKVAILALPRTSSTSLYRTLSKLYSFDVKRTEPFNKTFKYNDYINFDKPVNILTKLIYSEYCLSPGIDNLEEFLIWIKNTFTHVICLYRENTYLQSYSLLYHNKMGEIVGNNKHSWHSPILTDPKLLDVKNIENTKLFFDSENLILKRYSLENNYFLAKYEDLIINEGDNNTFRDICNYINIDFDYDKIYKNYKKENKVTIRREDIKLDKLI